MIFLDPSRTPKKDKYFKHRWGQCRVYRIVCLACQEDFCLYQKDGYSDQDLIRLYLDRIITPTDLTTKGSGYVCKKCGTILGSHMTYTKQGENREAIRLRLESLVKKKVES